MYADVKLDFLLAEDTFSLYVYTSQIRRERAGPLCDAKMARHGLLR